MSKKSPLKKPARAIRPDVPKTTFGRAEAAASLGVDIQTIDSLISAKTLRASKLGRRVLIRVADIEAMLTANPAVQ
ncbi:helix-turn-helix domain-containing protein [Bradyrhizobium sp. Ash2021]|uniref:helix-turn-helix domain-containing protein n=1 Tax=Bradyrhizobium sp. Ash2021 TaxID=2954771 RepID=UPI002815C034|nr:helix-turn-helix domain-containing protein [Bradyrhizobium sp. Ash2021]WMT75064.1 helix-turn-helix domain-containing protein [Bradyrhizobium sp. Ash2021]